MANEVETPLTIELATVEQIVVELLERSTFAGVIIRTEELKDQPLQGRPLGMHLAFSTRLTPSEIEQMLATALATWRERLRQIPPKNNDLSDQGQSPEQLR